MKTQQEIEQLAEKEYPVKEDLYSDLWSENEAYKKGYIQCQKDTQIEQNWNNFENELMQWSDKLGKEQKYIPFPAQVLDWLKENYKLPIKK